MQKFSNYDLIKLTVISAIGSGILFAHKEFAENIKSPYAIILIWLLSGAITLLQSLCYAELASIVKCGGGDASYLNKAFSKNLSIFYNIFSCFVILPASCSIGLSRICATLNITDSATKILVVFSTLILIFSPRNIWYLILTVFFYLKIFCLIILATLIILCKMDKSGFLYQAPEELNYSKFIVSLVNCTYFFAGYNSCNYLPGESIVSLRRPYCIATCVITIIYLYFSIGFMSIFNYESLMNRNDNIKAMCAVIYIDYLERYFNYRESLINFISIMIQFILYLGPVFGCHTVFDGIATSMLHKFNLNNHYRGVCILVYGCIISRVLLSEASFSILNYTSVLISGFYCLTFLALIKLRRTWKSEDKLNAAIPIFAFVISFGLTVYNVII